MAIQKRQAKAANESLFFLLVLAGIVVALNGLGVFVNGRLDATENELFSLSTGSRRLAASLGDQMEIRAYFSKEVPPQYASTERYVRDLLAEYRDASGGKVSVRFIHPEEDEDKQAAERDGVQRVQDQVLKADSFSVQESYRGVSFHYLGETKAIPRIDGTAGLEYEITQTIKELTGEKVKIGILKGHEGPTLTEGLTTLKTILRTYEIVEVAADKEIDKELKALLIMHPESALSETELRYIDQYVMRGGSLGVFGGTLKVDVSTGAPTATPQDSGINTLLEKWGIAIDDTIVADAQCGRARLPTQFGIAIPVPYPPVPIALLSEQQAEHPAMFRLNQVGMPYPAPLTFNDSLKDDAQVKRTTLANSSKNSWLMRGETIDLKSRERWQVPGYEGPFPIAAALEGKLPSAFAVASSSSEDEANQIEAPARAEKPVHVIVMGSGFFMRDEFLPQPGEGRRLIGGGPAFSHNVIDWLANDNDLIAIRAKTIEEPALAVPLTVKEAEATARQAYEEQDEEKFEAALEKRKAAVEAWDAKRDAYKWGNTLALPGVFALFGVARWRMRKAKKANLKL
ncbi:MAG: Gldg family protein [Myxococcales bacterium]|nr:Gldg family protein [Myxococcales bacterium]